MKKDESLSKSITEIIRNKGTELPHSGIYNKHTKQGTYLCRGCGCALFRSHSKFSSSCGWPSFDDSIGNTVLEVRDADGKREEILCAQCHAHLGHVFDGEGFTSTNRRFCVNSLSLDFVEDSKLMDTEEAIVAGGCFWEVQHLLNKLPGVVQTEVGYIGGNTANPSYQEVCSGSTGHFEAVRILFDPVQLSYENLIKYFFEIHDPTQKDGQGPDKGEQYKSALFYYNKEQKEIAQQVLLELKQKGYDAVTQILPVSIFWPAESNHQNYYDKTQHEPYCHIYVKRF